MTFWDKLEPDDLMAYILVTGMVVLMAMGKNSVLHDLFAAVAGFYLLEKRVRKYRRGK